MASDLDRDPRIRIGSGRLVDPYNLCPEDIVPYYMMRALSHICRFTGHSKYPYTVGQHTLVLAHHVPKHLVRAAIIHDWQEAFFNDMASPVKNRPDMSGYKKAEKQAGDYIAKLFNVTEPYLDELDEYDKRLYADERDNLFEFIYEPGRGDDLVPLDVHPIHFRYRDSRRVHEDLCALFVKHFKEPLK